MKSDHPYLAHIADAISAIENYVAGGRDAFLRGRMIQDAVIRNRLIHGYWSIDLPLVWNVIERELPPLKTAVASLLATPDPNGTTDMHR